MNSSDLFKWCLVLLVAVSAGDVAARGSGGGRSGGSHSGGHSSHGHFRSAVVVGGAIWSPWYYPSPYYYSSPYYPAAVYDSSPPVYIEQSAAAPAPAAEAVPAGYWYYCDETKAYYPYVNACPGGWLRVAPQPPGVQ